MAIHAYSAFADTRITPLPSNAASFLVFDHVQPAFLLDGAGPAAGPVILAVADRPGARPAADAWVTFVMQRVVGDAVLVDEAPHLALGPAQQGVDLHQAKLGVPLDHSRRRPMGR